MTTAAKVTNEKSFLRVVKGIVEKQSQLNLLTTTAWLFALTALWNNAIFSQTQITEAKEQIADFLNSYKNPVKAYKAFCQRVLLARQYVLTQPNRFIPLPTIWLNKNNATGFVGTREWYKKILDTRAAMPQFKAELKALAEAVLEMQEDPTVENFQYWKNYFIEKRATGLLELFMMTVANQQFEL
jgi:hypothetical protein